MKNNLSFFFPSIVKYPYDPFSRIIDLHLLIIKIFLSISDVTYNENISKFLYFLSLIIYFILSFYLTYIILQKSYYLMNNCNLNKLKYSMILANCGIETNSPLPKLTNLIILAVYTIEIAI